MYFPEMTHFVFNHTNAVQMLILRGAFKTICTAIFLSDTITCLLARVRHDLCVSHLWIVWSLHVYSALWSSFCSSCSVSERKCRRNHEQNRISGICKCILHSQCAVMLLKDRDSACLPCSALWCGRDWQAEPYRPFTSPLLWLVKKCIKKWQ